MSITLFFILTNKIAKLTFFPFKITYIKIYLILKINNLWNTKNKLPKVLQFFR